MCQPLTVHYLKCNHLIPCGKRPCPYTRPAEPDSSTTPRDAEKLAALCAAEGEKGQCTEAILGLCGRCEWKALDENEQ